MTFSFLLILLRSVFTGYLVTISIETPVLVMGLSKMHALKTKLLAGIWLTACTYPIVVVVLPQLFSGQEKWLYVTVAEIFAPVAECILFVAAIGTKEYLRSKEIKIDCAAIILANLASFGLGEVLKAMNILHSSL